jgi:hypothetical protein
MLMSSIKEKSLLCFNTLSLEVVEYQGGFLSYILLPSTLYKKRKVWSGVNGAGMMKERSDVDGLKLITRFPPLSSISACRRRHQITQTWLICLAW